MFPGILVEGIGGVICGIIGTGNALTSYSQNIAAISLTKVGPGQCHCKGWPRATSSLLFGDYDNIKQNHAPLSVFVVRLRQKQSGQFSSLKNPIA